MSTVSVYTTHDQTEQPQTIHHVTALSVVGDGLLTIEAEQDGGGTTFRGFHRFQPGEWAHFSMAFYGPTRSGRSPEAAP